MARQKKRAADAPVLPAAPSTGVRLGVVEMIALALILVTAVNSWLIRYALNPDGVSYLDLAERLSRGDAGAFVQGYWSPLYPALIALIGEVVGGSHTALLTIAHLINGTAIIGAILLLWWWGRTDGGPIFARAAFAALFLVSYGYPRLEAVTPDVLVLALMTWLGHELLVERGARWWWTGLLFGVIYLVKTSAWPWFLLSIPLRLWGARDAAGRGDVLRSLPVALAVMALWVVPMSVKAGHPTFGSAARLNYCWYLNACDSQSPDEHQGGHVAYHSMAIDATRTITWAEFDADRWTYQPWSDPTGWDAGVLTRSTRTPKPAELMHYWGRLAWRTLSLWLLPVLAGVLLPWSLLEWRPERRRWWIGEGRPALVVALLGLAGILQFIMIHAEPRLLAPYAMLLLLAVLYGGSGARGSAATPSLSRVRQGAGWLGLILVVGFGRGKLREAVDAGREWDQNVVTMAATNASMAAAGVSQERIVVLGPAIPAAAGAFVARAHIVAQLLPASALTLDQLPADRRQALLAELFGEKAQIAWRTAANGSVSFIDLRKR